MLQSPAMAPLAPVTASPIVNYFRPRREGPEAVIEDSVAAQLHTLFEDGGRDCWTAGSVPLGAGMPDLMIVAYKRLALALAGADLSDAHILGYLRAVGSARLDTIAERMRVTQKSASRRLYRLVEARALRVTPADTFSLTSVCRTSCPKSPRSRSRSKTGSAAPIKLGATSYFRTAPSWRCRRRSRSASRGDRRLPDPAWASWR